MSDQTHMLREVREIPAATARLLDSGREAIGDAATRLRTKDPAFLVTIARGSSDHATAYIKYAIELTAGLPVASLGPSIASVYRKPLKLRTGAALAISQSGKSPDILDLVKTAGQGGALTIGITNTAGSPLSGATDVTIDMAAGEEISVAATKTFVNSIVSGLAVLAEWQQDAGLRDAVAALPEAFEKALACDWSDLITALDGHDSLFVLGRGPAMAIANEAALKFKETCGMQGEAYSAAEVLHGPVSLVAEGFPVLAFAGRDAAEKAVADTANDMAAKGARAFLTSAHADAARKLPFAETGHPITDPLALIVSFYGFVEALARHRGLNPDTPPRLKKVTETV
ncbi:glucosamine--fructose-6-phosphate aminotransferase [Devosia pacifica]|uniref:Glucosamine--fructose-6-phosphate aminotransferase n=1 Tax=Devosia pacifica TaxID=1335967 RepID=A0A918SDF4_9HYPH|nr:SIS domain-containing protein [Devosia pacifica]GHA36233.1 glucosamine--fructose-6-phosphate aminotransferase [Devosia pacifica]